MILDHKFNLKAQTNGELQSKLILEIPNFIILHMVGNGERLKERG